MSDCHSLMPLAQEVGGFLLGILTLILPLLVVLLL
jgi:sorbitol-specific phosphotransferase system component IIC